MLKDVTKNVIDLHNEIRSTEVLLKTQFHLTSSGKWILILDVEAEETLSISVGSVVSPLF